MEEWKVYKIKDICKGIYEGPHATPKESQTGGIYLGIPAISVDGHINFRNAKRIAEEDLPLWTKRVTPQEDDIVFTNEATLNLYALIPAGFHGCLGRRLGLVRPNNEIVNAKYLFYYFFSPEWRNVISQNKVYGATVERILMTKFPSFPIKLPSLSVQNSIVNILSSLDDKIEINRRINENLEQQAQALFKSWFVDFEPFKDGEFVESELGMIPKGWRVVSLGDLMCYNGGSQPPASEFIEVYKEGYIRFIQIRDYASDGHITYIPISKRNKLCDVKDIMIARYGASLGRICFGLKGAYNVALAKVTPLKDYFREYLRCFLNTREFYEGINNKGNRAVQAGFNQSDIQSFRLPFPTDDDIIMVFEKLCSSYFERRLLNDQESRRLATLRDTLLPKLMSGELKVNEVEI